MICHVHLHFCKQELDFATLSAHGGPRLCDHHTVKQPWSHGLPDQGCSWHFTTLSKHTQGQGLQGRTQHRVKKSQPVSSLKRETFRSSLPKTLHHSRYLCEPSIDLPCAQPRQGGTCELLQRDLLGKEQAQGSIPRNMSWHHDTEPTSYYTV